MYINYDIGIVSEWCMVCLLDNIPQGAIIVQKNEAVGCGDRVKRRLLFVPEEDIRDPKESPHVVVQLNPGFETVLESIELQPTVVPLLPQIDAQRIILDTYVHTNEREVRINPHVRIIGTLLLSFL